MHKYKYTEIKDLLNTESDTLPENYLAYLTHYMHNLHSDSSNTYKLSLSMIDSSIKIKDLIFQPNLEINWDIPFPPPEIPKFTFIDLFAGIGGFRLALQGVGGKCVFSSEIDKSARSTYELNYGEVPFGDIRDFTGEQVNDEQLDKLIPDHDILTGGFPCQPFSLAGVSARNFLGKEHGFNDHKQGNLFFDIMRIVRIKKPKVLFLENVKNLKSHNGGETFNTIKQMITEQNYNFSFAIVNAASVVPQKRERTYMVCFRDYDPCFLFPNFDGEHIPLKSILDSIVDKKFTISDKLWEGHQKRSKRNKDRGTGFTVNLADVNKPANTIVARYYKDGKECLIPQIDKNPRMLTPRECARAFGYPENFVIPESKAIAYKQFGNSVAIPVIQRISQYIIKTMEKYELIR